MKNIVTILLVLFTACGVKAQSVEEYLQIATDSNPGLKARYAEFEAAMQRIKQVRSLPDPTLSMSAFGQMIETRVGPQRAIFIFNQMFPWFGTLKAKGDATALFAEAKFQAWLDARNELLFKVKSAWYPLYELEQVVRFQQENKNILETYKTLAETKFRNGTGTMVNVIRADIMLQDVNTDLTLLQDKRKPLLAQFNKLLNRDMDSEVAIIDTLVPDISPSIFSVDSMMQKNPRLTELDKKRSAWEQQKVAAKRQGMPKLGVGLNYTVIGQRKDVSIPGNGKDAIMPMFSVSVPIYRGKYKASVRESELMLTSVQFMKQEVSNNLMAGYSTAQYEREKAIEQYRLFVMQAKKTQQATNLLLSAYSTSGKDFEEVLRMQQLLLKYKIAAAGATKDYFTANARLAYLTAKH